MLTPEDSDSLKQTCLLLRSYSRSWLYVSHLFTHSLSPTLLPNTIVCLSHVIVLFV